MSTVHVIRKLVPYLDLRVSDRKRLRGQGPEKRGTPQADQPTTEAIQRVRAWCHVNDAWYIPLTEGPVLLEHMVGISHDSTYC